MNALFYFYESKNFRRLKDLASSPRSQKYCLIRKGRLCFSCERKGIDYNYISLLYFLQKTFSYCDAKRMLPLNVKRLPLLFCYFLYGKIVQYSGYTLFLHSYKMGNRAIVEK